MTASWDEFGLIARCFRPLSAQEAGAFNLTDDAAVLTPTPNHDWVVTADALVAGIHFFPDDPPEDIAKKALRVNLSDLAAMGAKPRCVFMTCALPKNLENNWLEDFSDSLGDDLERFAIALTGGDVVATTGPLTLSLTLMGEAENGAVLRRSCAQPGDIIAVTGSIGDASLGLALQKGEGPDTLSAEEQAYLIERYRIPQPRIAAGQALNGIAHAALDISDGLCADIRHMAQASKCNITIDPARIPLSSAAQTWLAAREEDLDKVLTGGDDYELAFACAPEDFMELARLLNDQNVPVTAIGRAEAGDGNIFKISPSGHRVLIDVPGGHRHG